MKKIIATLIAILGAASLAGCSNNDPSYEVVYIHRSRESAEIMADNFNMELVRYSVYGVTTYSTKSEKQYQSLLATMGFANNDTYDVVEWAGTDDFYTNDQYSIPMVGADLAWGITTGSEDVVVAVIDTGVDIDHPELVSSLHENSFNANTDTIGLQYVDDGAGHGTRVSGIIASDKDNSIGLAGIAPDVKVMAIKANHGLDTGMSSETTSMRAASVINGILHAIDQGVDVINLSFGGSSTNTLMENAINQAFEAGIVVVAAAGNSGTERYMYPASYDNVISVASVDSESVVSGFSTFNDKVDISAPGTYLPTTDIGGYYAHVNGTSFAAPVVAASAALLLSVYPDMTPQEVREKLQSTSVDAGEPGLDKKYGHGIVNVYNAMSSDMATVTFNTDGGTVIDPIRVVPGNTLTLDGEPLKIHHDFVGWYKDSSFTVEWTNGSIVENSMILYAKWTPMNYTMNFYNEGNLVSSQSVTYGSLATEPEVAKEGHTFAGWYTYNNELYDISSTPTDNVDLYAKWSVNTYSVIYLDSSGNVHASYDYEYGASVTHAAPEGPAKEFYDFVGWVGTVPSSMPAGNVVLTPEYAKRIGVIYVTITITIVYEDGTEEVITIEVPQDQVDDIISQYGEGSVTVNN